MASSGCAGDDSRRPPRPLLQKLIAGGQTGVDRAALDSALELGIPCGGWVPKGRKAEDGVIPERYPVHETQSGDYAQRTAMNVEAADGTLILNEGVLEGGTALTAEHALSLGKPHLIVDLHGDGDTAMAGIEAWWRAAVGHGSGVLNVAGPRESQRPGIYRRAKAFLLELLPSLGAPSAS